MLGARIVSHLKEQGKEVAVLDVRLVKELEKVEYVQGDITVQADIDAAIEKTKPEVVIHTASPVHGQSKAIYEKVNVEGTKNVIAACVESPLVKALVYTSSASVTFDGSDLYNASEKAMYADPAFDDYQETKKVAEEAVLKANGSDLATCVLRPSGIFGEGDQQMVPTVLKLGDTGKSKWQIGKNENLVDFTYVGNVADAHILAAERLLSQIEKPPVEDETRIAGEVFNITNGEPVYFWNMMRRIWALDGHYPTSTWYLPSLLAWVFGLLFEIVTYFTRTEPTFTRFRVQLACANRYYDIRKAVNTLGYRPSVTLDEGLKRTVAWARSEMAKS